MVGVRTFDLVRNEEMDESRYKSCRQQWRQVLIIENGRNGPPLRGVPAAIRGSILKNEKPKL